MAEPPSTKRLFVLRHAKSSWDEPDLEDHDRPLAARGRRATELLCGYLQQQDIQPELILCSSARRARETLERAVLEAAGRKPAAATGEIRLERELYGASGSELIERLWRVPEDTNSVMLIGHNPGLQTLLTTLAAPPDTAHTPSREPSARLDAVHEKFPTGALATLTFACPWRRLEPGCAELTGFVRPRDLE